MAPGKKNTSKGTRVRESRSPRAGVTIHDVAREAGVSPSTVSHALSGKRPIGQEVKDRIARVVADLGYRPDVRAVSLSLKRTRQIGILVQEVSGAMTGLLLEGMEGVAREKGYKVILGITGLNREVARDYLKDFAAGMVDGVLNMVPMVGAEEAVSLCPAIPVVTYERPYPECPAIDDRETGARDLVVHLQEQGHDRIGLLYVKDPAPELTRESILEGYARARQLAGRPVDLSLAIAIDPRSVVEIEAACHRLEREGVTAIFCSSDAIASVVLRWARNHDRRVPEDLSVAGFDDAPLAAMLVPPLTSVAKPVSSLARHTVEALVSRMNGMAISPTVTLPMALRIRESTGPVSLNGRGKTTGHAGIRGGSKTLVLGTLS